MDDDREASGEGTAHGAKPADIDFTETEFPTASSRVEFSLKVGEARLSVLSRRSRTWLRIFFILAPVSLLGVSLYVAFQQDDNRLALATALAALATSLGGLAGSLLAIRAQRKERESIEILQRLIQLSPENMRMRHSRTVSDEAESLE